MPIELTREADANTLFIHVSGKLVKADYEHFLPEFERLVSGNRKLRVLFDVTDLSGWDAGALWEEIKFDVKHFADFERLAVIGDQKWEEVMTSLCKPFTHAALCYFDEGHFEEARKWLKGPRIQKEALLGPRPLSGVLLPDEHGPSNSTQPGAPGRSF